MVSHTGSLAFVWNHSDDYVKLIRYSDHKNSIVARVHMTIMRNVDDSKDTAELVGIGLIDVDSAARAMVARILKGEKTTLFSDLSARYKEYDLRSEKYQYRFVTRPIGKLTHSILLHKSAMDEQLSDSSSRIIISPDGENVPELFLRRFSNDFNLPYVEEWADVIWTECIALNLVGDLRVWTDEQIREWEYLVAFEISAELDEDKAKEIVSKLLRTGEIVLPEGVTEAPALSDVLVPDEESGEVRVTDYLQTYAPHLATAIEDMATPAHDLDQGIDPAIAKMMRVPFPSQAHTSQAILKGFQDSKGVILAGDMGVGKSIIASAVANALASGSKNGFVALLLVPGITIPKWITGELKKTVPWAKITHFRNWHDVIRYREERIRSGKKEPLEFILLSRDTAKFGMPKVPALIHKEKWVVPNKANWETKASRADMIRDVWLCPDCGAIQQTDTKSAKQEAKKRSYEVEQLYELKLGFKDLADKVIEHRDSEGDTKRQIVWKKNISDYHCTSCGHNLMRDALPDKEHVVGLKKRRLQPAWLIQKLFKNWLDLVVVDELHQYKNASGQGIAMESIVGAAKHVLGLTGTLSDGSASSLYHLLWRIAPQQMKDDGMDHRSLNKFVHRYGTLEQKGRYAKDEVAKAGGSTERQIIMNPPKEIPGLSPRLFVNHLSDKAVFLELGDIGLPLVELEERPVFIQAETVHQDEYGLFHNGLETTMRQQYAIGNKAAFASFIPATVNAANQPHKSQEIYLGEDSVVFQAPNDEYQYAAKEQRIIEDVKEEIAQNRRCVIYVRYSGNAAQDRRLVDILKREGISVKHLQASVSPEARVEWLEKAVEEDAQVVVSNVKLVEVGIDLMPFPTLMFYQFTDEVATMRQAAKRSWRISQHRKCKIFYYVYQQTYEMVQLKRMLKKRSHSMLLEGRLEKSEVGAFIEHDDKSASTFAIASCLGDVEDLTKKWTVLADRDIPVGVTMLAEDVFKNELVRAMQRLSWETRRIAGVTEEVEYVPSSEVINIPHTTQRVAKPVVDLPLFAEASESTIDHNPVTDAPRALTVGDIRSQMGLVSKAKKKRIAPKVSDDQIVLFSF